MDIPKGRSNKRPSIPQPSSGWVAWTLSKKDMAIRLQRIAMPPEFVAKA
jgi:hypothetical protein